MATREQIQARLAAIEERRREHAKVLQAKRAKLKAKLAAFDRPSKSQRRSDARRKILLGAFVLEQLERTGTAPHSLTFEGKRFFEWLVRPTDQAVFEGLAFKTPAAEVSAADRPAAATDTPLNVPFADKDQAKALGAQWQPEKKRWVVPKGVDLTPFAPWLG